MKAIRGIHWDLFDCDGSENGSRQIQNCDDDESKLFKTDLEAIQYVISNKDTCAACADALLFCDDKLVDEILKRV